MLLGPNNTKITKKFRRPNNYNPEIAVLNAEGCERGEDCLQKVRRIAIIQQIEVFFGMKICEVQSTRPYTLCGDDADFELTYSLFEIYFKSKLATLSTKS